MSVFGRALSKEAARVSALHICMKLDHQYLQNALAYILEGFLAVFKSHIDLFFVHRAWEP